MSSVPERSDIEPEYKWEVERIYADEDEWEDAYDAIEERLDDLAAYEGRVTEDGETLLALLELYESVMREVEQVIAYARMKRDEDTRNQTYQALFSRAQTLASEASSAASFIEPELQTLSREELDELIAETDGLAVYEHYLDDIVRMKPHTRSAEVENLLAELGEVLGAAGDAYSMLTNADMEYPTVEGPDGEPVEITQSSFTTLLKNPDREFRRTVYEGFYDELSSVRNTIGTTYKHKVKTDVKMAHARNYETAREAALDAPNVPESVYDNLVETVEDHLDLLHRHAELKRECFEVDELRMWDVYMPMTETESPDVSYEEAAEYVTEAVAPLGEDYQSRLADGLGSRWVDVYENVGKRSGAYSGGTYDTQPYILMNYQDDITSMYTLAHELGHSLHSQLASETQPYVYGDYTIFVAEVASTVNESLLTRHLLETVDDPEFRRHVLNESLERFRTTLYRQTMFADFEHRAHQAVEAGEALTPDRLDGLYDGLKENYYEPAVLDDRIAGEWMRIPHFYSAYYVYQYSTGISAAVALAADILSDGESAAERYLEFLRRGSREYPLELLAGAGVDMSTPGPIEDALAVYEDYMDEMAVLI
jgi:oligoendopeptidase F